ncbi:Malate synthase A [Providencia alcalifaciens]|nr:Malate synthase A [Providencia alcalifaciens]
MNQQLSISDLTFTKAFSQQAKNILDTDSVGFLSFLVDEFLPRREQLLKDRVLRQKSIDSGGLPDFIMESDSIKNSDWKIQNIPDDLQDRRIEITGPVDRKMVINALNANVKVFMADFEDSLSPSWERLIDGQINLRDAITGEISYTNENGKVYQLKSNPAVLIARVRGLHLDEKHVLVGGKPIPGGLFDFALYFFNNYQVLLAKGSGPYFYIPKLESWQEAQWWSDVFSAAEDFVGLPRGTIKATVLIETLPAVFQMDEIYTTCVTTLWG